MKNLFVMLLVFTTSSVFASDSEVKVFVMASQCDSVSKETGSQSTHLASKGYNMRLSDFSTGEPVEKIELGSDGKIETTMDLFNNKIQVKARYIGNDGRSIGSAKLITKIGDSAQAKSGLCEDSTDVNSLNIVVSVEQ